MPLTIRDNKSLQVKDQELENTAYIKKLEDKIKHLTDSRGQLIRAEKIAVLRELASAIGHELRNPFASIKNIAYYLTKTAKPIDPKFNEFLDMLSKEIDRANKIVTELIDFSENENLNIKSPAEQNKGERNSMRPCYCKRRDKKA
jgi:signal transduction histidine kinase